MPVPLIIWAGYAISAAAVAAATAEVVSGDNESFEPPEALRRLVAAVVNWCVGERIVEADDLSSKAAFDAGLVRLINGRSPIQVTTLLNKEQFQRDLLNGAAQMASNKAGFPIRTLFDKEMLTEDLLYAASELMAQKTGLKLNNLRDVDQVKKDVLSYGANRLASEAGIYLSDPSDIEQVKADLLEHGAQVGLQRIVSEIQTAMNATDKDNVRLSQLMERAGLGNVKPAEMVKQANTVLLGFADRRFAQVKIETKKERRRAQLRIAQKKFRARHSQPWSSIYTGVPGGMQYVPVGGGGPERKAKGAAQATEALPVESSQVGAGYEPARVEDYGQSKAKWAKDGKFNAGKVEYPMSKPATPAGLNIGRRKK